MNKVTSITTHKTLEGTRLSITYSVISEDGQIENSNTRVNRLVVDTEMQEHVDALTAYAQDIVDTI